MPNFDQEKTTTIDGWKVTYPAKCNGKGADIGFVEAPWGYSDFVHFDKDGNPYGTYMPKGVTARMIVMRKHFFHNAGVIYFDTFMNRVLMAFPDAQVDCDNEGNVTIFPNLKYGQDVYGRDFVEPISEKDE